MDRFQYFLLMGACFVLTLPLEFVFRARIYRRPARLLRTLWLPVVVFSVWDTVAIARDHWSFNGRYVTGWEVPYHLPVEEIAFFVIIPICALLTFEASRRVLGRSSSTTGGADAGVLDRRSGRRGGRRAL